jgi:hypothetical protein
MSFAATLANGAWLASNLPAWIRFHRALRRPAETQRTLLLRLLDENAGSAYGRQHGFAGIRSCEQFREHVPIVTYDALEPWIARVMRGEPRVLTCAPVTRLVPTSGSTSARKLIPYTAPFQKQLNAAVGPWIVDLCRRHPSTAGGPAYWSISPALSSASEESTVPIGFDDDSAYLGGFRQRLAAATFAVPSALRLVTDVATHRYLTLLCLLRRSDLRLISVWHPSFLTLLLDALPAHWAELLNDLERGGCRRAATLAPPLREAFEFPARPGRAAALRRTGPEDPHALWPHLRAVSCWGDGQAALALAHLQKRIPRATFQSKGLLATEAVVSIPFRGLHPVAITSHYFEFEDSTGALRLVHELRRGEIYAVIVTTGGGLWRYRLGDHVEVDGFVGSTPSLRFLGRGASVSDLRGEKLAESFVTQALRLAGVVTGFTPAFALLAPESGDGAPPHYTLFVEGDPPASFLPAVESELRKNPHYALCRDLGQLGALQCLRILRGAYERFSSTGTSQGRRLGDIKPQTLSARTDWRSHLAEPARGDGRN